MTVLGDAGRPPQADSYDRLIGGAEADKICGVSRSRRYQLVREGKFPKPVKHGKSTRFSLLECQAFVRALLASRGGA
jgi:predicted DNA-binding transcriptional regulator AlpA